MSTYRERARSEFNLRPNLAVWQDFSDLIDDDLWLLHEYEALAAEEARLHDRLAAVERRRARLDLYAAGVIADERELRAKHGRPVVRGGDGNP